MLRLKKLTPKFCMICKQSVRFESEEKITTKYNKVVFNNPSIKRHQEIRDSVSHDFHKQTTGLTGLYVNEQPHRQLRTLYNRILLALKKIPSEAAYRKTTETIVNDRLAIVENEPDIQKMEEKIGMGQIEEVIDQAQNELQTARLMVEYRIWESLVEEPPEDQYRWPIR